MRTVIYSFFLFISLSIHFALSKVQEGLSEQLTTHTYKATAVFDIDEVTCRRATQEEMEQHKPARYFPMSTVIDWTDIQTGPRIC